MLAVFLSTALQLRFNPPASACSARASQCVWGSTSQNPQRKSCTNSSKPPLQLSFHVMASVSVSTSEEAMMRTLEDAIEATERAVEVFRRSRLKRPLNISKDHTRTRLSGQDDGCWTSGRCSSPARVMRYTSAFEALALRDPGIEGNEAYALSFSAKLRGGLQ